MLETLYYVCAGPVLVIVVVLALIQVRGLRDQMERTERQHRRVLTLEGERRAVDVADTFIVELVPEITRVSAPLAQFHRGEWAEVMRGEPRFDWDAVVADDNDRTRFGIQLISAVNLDAAAVVLGRLESIALQFNRGVASDGIGKPLLRGPLLEAVGMLWPLMAWQRTSAPGACVELIKLYGRWSATEGSQDAGHH